MASSQLKSENVTGPGAGFPFAWRGPVALGSETVITTLRSESPAAPVAVVESSETEPSPDITRRLFPAGAEVEEALGIRLGHFTIQRRIGVGGMGSVFLATDDRLRRAVALKILSPAMTSDPASVLRFQNEARAAARLDHDNIARIFYYGEDCGLHYIAYEYIPGSNLRDVIRSKERLSPAEAVNYAMQLTAALSHTAAAGIIHRDIKPSNVLITPLGRAKLVDLGLARKESSDSSIELTVAGTTLGTFDYISPEQAKDPRNVDVRSDIYSLGCTLYHMITGEPPYPEGTVLQKLLDHQGKDAPDPARKNRRVPPALSAIVRKMMASDPRRRYSSPAKLLSDLLQVARSLGTGAVPIDGQVWLTATRAEQSAWHGNVGWIATAAALLILVIAMERFPPSTFITQGARRLNPRANTGAHPNTTLENSRLPASMEPVGKIPPSPSVSPAPTTAMSEKGSGTSRASTGPTPTVGRPTEVVKTDAGTPPKLFEKLPILSSAIPGETETTVSLSPPKPTIIESPSTSEPSPETPMPARTVSGAGSSTATTPTAVSTETRPVISILGGKSYETLEAACSEAKDGTIIELRYNGRRRETERPIRLPKKENVIIRSGIGFRPVIEFAPTTPPTDAAQSRMVTVTGGSLELVNVDLLLTIPDRITADRWALFSLERPKELQLHDVTITVVNPSGQPACVIEQVAAPGQGVGNVGMMKNGSPLEPPKVSIFNSIFRGQSDLILLRDAVPARFQLKDAVVGIQGVLFRATCQAEFSNSENDRVVLELDHTTCLAAEGLIVTEGVDNLSDHTPPLMVNARNNIIWCAPNRPMISMLDAGDLMEMQRRFFWTGDRNYYDSIDVFWQLGGHQGLSTARLLDFVEWRSFWGAAEGTGSINAPITWRVKPLERIWTKIDGASVELDVASNSNPAVNGASDGRDAGATLGKLPPVPRDGLAPMPDKLIDSE